METIPNNVKVNEKTIKSNLIRMDIYERLVFYWKPVAMITNWNKFLKRIIKLRRIFIS